MYNCYYKEELSECYVSNVDHTVYAYLIINDPNFQESIAAND